MLQVDLNAINLRSLLVNRTGQRPHQVRVTRNTHYGVAVDCRVILVVVENVLSNCSVVVWIDATFCYSTIPEITADDVGDVEQRIFFDIGADEVLDVLGEVTKREVAAVRVVPLYGQVNVE